MSSRLQRVEREGDVLLPKEAQTVLTALGRSRRMALVLRVMLLVSMVLPFGLVAAYAGITYRTVLQDLEDVARRTVDVLAEHTLKVFETQDLILDQSVNLLSGRDPDAVADSPGLGAALRHLQRNREQIAGIFILNAKGDLRAGSDWKPGLSALDRDYFRHFQQQPEDQGTFVGKAITGRVTGRPAFGFSRRWPAPDGTFLGVVGVSVSADYFAGFFRDTAPEIEHLAALVRTDGEVLARDPPRASPPDPIPSNDPLMQAIARADRGQLWRASRSDGVERLYTFRRVDGYPVVVTTAVARSAILAPWLKGVYLYAGVSAAAALAMLGLTQFGLRLARREEEALAHAAAVERERAEIEARLRRSQKLEALGELTGGVAHDFGNLLTPIIGNLQLLRRELDRPQLMSRVSNALAAAELGTGLVNSLLAFARRQPLVLATLDANSALTEMRPLLLQTLGSMGTLVLRLAPALWQVEADVTQLQMAVINLVANARDALAVRGVVTIETRNATVQGEPEGLMGDFVVLAVNDNGSGMTPDVLAHIFEPFFTTKGPGKGTGLGLATVYGFAKQCGGNVAVDSTAGAGTTVTIYLPRRATAAGRPSEETAG